MKLNTWRHEWTLLQNLKHEFHNILCLYAAHDAHDILEMRILQKISIGNKNVFSILGGQEKFDLLKCLKVI